MVNRGHCIDQSMAGHYVCSGSQLNAESYGLVNADCLGTRDDPQTLMPWCYLVWFCRHCYSCLISDTLLMEDELDSCGVKSFWKDKTWGYFRIRTSFRWCSTIYIVFQMYGILKTMDGMVWQPRVYVNNTLFLSCLGGCTFLAVRRKRTGFPAGSSPVGLPLAGPCSVTLLLGPGGVKNNPALDPGWGGYSAWYSNGRHVYGRSCQSRIQAGRETRLEQKRRIEPRLTDSHRRQGAGIRESTEEMMFGTWEEK